MRVSDFDYHLPDEAIAQEAREPRDAARLLVTSSLEDRKFLDLAPLLEPVDLVVVNSTRVRAARLRGRKAGSGGAVELLLTRRLDAIRWEALARPARRLREGTALEFEHITGVVEGEPDHGVVVVRLHAAGGDVEDVLPAVGEVPLPPYFHGQLAHPDRYQTIFAKSVGSAAAPTAGLHFTPRVLQTLAARGIDVAEVELHVGLETFRPMEEGDLEDHRIHTETYFVPESTCEAVDRTLARGGRVVAIGTTVVRTLESATTDFLQPGKGTTELFIKPGHVFKCVDLVVTNFHAPRTTLLVMVAAMLGPRWLGVYEHALAHGYRFLSFGDAMFIDTPLRP